MPQIKTLEQAKLKLRNLRSKVQSDFDLDIYGIVGSFARGQQSQNSDLDIVCKNNGAATIFKLLHATDFLESELGLKVDLVFPSALPDYSREFMLEGIVEL
jgi:uncharacterized protein